MHWFSTLIFLGTIGLIVGTGTQVDAERSMTAGDKIQSPNNNIHTAQLAATNMGRFRYQDGEVTLFQNQFKPSDFFFTPFPHVEPSLTECIDNEFSGHIELTLTASLYTVSLLESVKRHITNQNGTCQTKLCGVSLLPMHSIRLVQKGLQTPESKKKFSLNSEWQSNTPLLQTIQFIIYTSNMSICESLKNSITSRCRLSNFEVQYSLEGQQTAARTIEVSTEHIMKTSMYNDIKSQLSPNDRDIIALTGNDYKDLVSETMDQITMQIRVEEGFESMQDPVAIERLLDRQLQYKQVQLTKVGDALWESLYWTPELTRPDRLSKILNKLIKQDATDSDKFRYDYSQADEAMKQDLKLHDRQNLDKLEKHRAVQEKDTTNTRDVNVHLGYKIGGSFLGTASLGTKINADIGVRRGDSNKESKLNDDLIHYKIELERLNGTNNERKNGTKIALERKDAEKLVRYFSEHVEVEGDMIRPKPIDVTLVKFGFLKSKTNLFSNMVQVKTRMHVHVLPLRCPYGFRNLSLSNAWLAEKYDRLSSIVNDSNDAVGTKYANLSNAVGAKYDRLFYAVDAKFDRLSHTFDAKYDRLSHTVDAKYDRLSNAVDTKYDRLLSIVNDSNNAVDAKYDRLLSIVHNLTSIVDKTEPKTNVSINRNSAHTFAIQSGTSCFLKYPLVTDTEGYLFNKKRQSP